MFCPKCGKQLDSDNICINVNCNNYDKILTIISTDDNTLNSHNNQINSTRKNFYIHNLNSISVDEYSTFFGKNNCNYYLKYLNKFSMHKSFLSWNWTCFFFPACWLLYRKIYGLGAIILLIDSLLMFFYNSVSVLISLNIPLLTQISILHFYIPIHTIMALFANSIYLKYASKKIKDIKIFFPDSNEFDYFFKLKRTGGVNVWIPIVSMLIFLVCVYVPLFTALQAFMNSSALKH